MTKYDVVVSMNEKELELIITALSSMIPSSSEQEQIILRLHHDYNYALNEIRRIAK